MMKALIDSDAIAYRVGFACTRIWYTVDDMEFELKRQAKEYCDFIGEDYDNIIRHMESEPWPNIRHSLELTCNKIEDASDAKAYTYYLSGKDNFRKDIAVTQPYKGNRDPDFKPPALPQIMKYFQEEFKTIVSEGIEADDQIAIDHIPGETIIVAVDKDFQQLPGDHYNWVNQAWDVISEVDALRNFYSQILIGDVSDNIPGLPGIGVKKASALLSRLTEEGEMLRAIEQTWLNYLKKEVTKLGRTDFDEVTLMDRAYKDIEERGKLLWLLRQPLPNGIWKYPQEESVLIEERIRDTAQC